MRRLVLVVLSLVVMACSVGPPPGTNPNPGAPRFETSWRFLDGVTVGPDDKTEPPIPRTTKPAVYPEEARKQRLVGEVGLEFTLDDLGRVVDVRVVQSLEPTMDQAALEAARQWTFTPARLNGERKPSVAREAIEFALN